MNFIQRANNLTLRTRIILAIVVAVLILLAINFDFFWKNLAFTFNRPGESVPEEQAPQYLEDNHPRDEANMLWVDSLNIKAPIQFPVAINEDAFQEALLTGVAHYPTTALAGQKGNMYIFGHSSDFTFSKGQYKTVFALLPRIELGAQIKVTDVEGRIYYYTVIDKYPVSNENVEVLQQDYSKSILTLQTSYPVGTALGRYVVIAELAGP